jgi:hypothetical protein
MIDTELQNSTFVAGIAILPDACGPGKDAYTLIALGTEITLSPSSALISTATSRLDMVVLSELDDSSNEFFIACSNPNLVLIT